MTATTNNTAPSRSGTITITRWGSRHLRTVGGVRLAAGIVLIVLGALALSRGASGIAAFLLTIAAVHFVWGGWQLSIARSAGTRDR
jgi:N-acyl-L-homoserine lactone synthetase